MRWNSKAAQRSTLWNQWFAWHPVRIPDDPYTAGQWIWWETVERTAIPDSWDDYAWIYRLPE